MGNMEEVSYRDVVQSCVVSYKPQLRQDFNGNLNCARQFAVLLDNFKMQTKI